MLTVMTWLWSQPGGLTGYTAGHVNLWAAMVRRHLTLPHRLACVTDMAEGIDPSIEIISPPRDFENVRIPTWGPKAPQCLRRIAMFAPDAADRFGERFVNMDLDCVIGDSLDPLFDRPEDFVMFSGTSGRRPYNGSMLMMTAGARARVYTEFTPRGAAEAGRRYVGSDQAWISHVLGRGEATWGEAEGVYFWRPSATPWTAVAPAARVLFFPGHPKPWDLLGQSWIFQHYRLVRGGRCLVLGHAPTVWAEAAEALETGPFAAVIASPEAARHWPGRLDAVCEDDAHALRLAAHGDFADVVFCGRSPEPVFEEAAA